MSITGIGVDIENIERFKKYSLEKDEHFLKTIYSKNELNYCFSNKQFAQHLAVRFCAKEAFFKAVNDIIDDIKFSEIEILNKENGKPYINLPEKYNSLECYLSLSHDKDKAIAFVTVNEENNELNTAN